MGKLTPFIKKLNPIRLIMPMEKIKILLIDYEEDFIKNLSERIKSRNLELDLAVKGNQALELIVNEKPDVIILNLDTPDVVGMELLRDVKIIYPDIQVIILSRHYSIQDRMEALVAGAYMLFEKPVDIDDLIKTILRAYKEDRTTIKRALNNRLKFKLKTSESFPE